MDLATPAPSERRASPRNPWFAALLAFAIGAGFGHLYAGRARRGILLTVVMTAAGIAVVHGTMVAQTPWMRVLLLVMLPVVPLVLMGDAAAVARVETRKGWVPRWYNRWWVYAAWIGAGLLLPFSSLEWIRENVARAYSIPSLSMEPTLLRGDLLLAAPLPAGPVARGTIVVYRGGDGGDYVARVVGMPGDTPEMRGKMLFVNGRALREQGYRI